MSQSENKDPLQPNDKRTDPGETYGTTWSVTSDADIAFGELGKIIPKHDVDAVVQHLKVTLLTPEGAHPFLDDYGLDVFQAIGTSNEQLKMAIRGAIGPEAQGIERVESIPNIELSKEGQDRYDINAAIEVKLLDGRYFEFDFGVREDAYY